MYMALASEHKAEPVADDPADSASTPALEM
jgi:hypothetical protein